MSSKVLATGSVDASVRLFSLNWAPPLSVIILAVRTLFKKSPLSLSKEWATHRQNILSAAQPPFARSVALRPILSNSLPLSAMSFLAFQELPAGKFSTGYVHLYPAILPRLYYIEQAIFVKTILHQSPPNRLTSAEIWLWKDRLSDLASGG